MTGAAAPRPRAGIVVTGTEVLTGIVSDANGPWVSARLGELGIDVESILVVGDRPDDLRAALEHLTALGLDLIVTSGGLGPTADDLTAEVVARHAGRELRLDSAMEERIAGILAEFARRFETDREALAAANRKQAMVPEGALALDPAGTAPGLVVPPRDEGPLTVVLPGPPRELQAMWPAALEAPAVRELLDRTPERGVETLRIFGAPESEIAKTLREAESEGLELTELEITTCLRRAELEIVVAYPASARPRYEALEERIATEYGRRLFSRDGSTIDEQVAGLLTGRRIGLGESCSAGLLAARLADRPGSSEYLMGGVVAYSNAAKSEHLGVPEELIAEHGAVSPPVAAAMAEGARERFGGDLGVGITGVAGPGGGTEAKPVGYVCICATAGGERRVERDPVLPGDRATIRDRSTTVALHMLRSLLASHPG
ncbi:competence/damage-inducible protein A [Thermoleophilia bacterium SCSIO 60948]|nr:competence/damage-inducible protein A [Thermoleophilia bacterium SCSIO 60948]